MPLNLKFSEWLLMNPWLTIASLIIAILGVALAIIFFLKAKRVKLPFYADRSINIVKDLVGRFESLEMLYSGQPIENLTVTKLAFWNAGGDTINGQHIASVDPLSVHVKKGCKILDAKILYMKNPANQFSTITSPDQSHITFQFDYVDKDEGVVIQLIHTGISNEDIEFRGAIKGAGRPTRRFVPIPSTKRRRYMKAIIFVCVPPAFMVYLLFLASEFLAEPQHPLLLIFKVLLIVNIFTVYPVIAFDVLKRKLPKGFDIFEKEF